MGVPARGTQTVEKVCVECLERAVFVPRRLLVPPTQLGKPQNSLSLIEQ